MITIPALTLQSTRIQSVRLNPALQTKFALMDKFWLKKSVSAKSSEFGLMANACVNLLYQKEMETVSVQMTLLLIQMEIALKNVLLDKIWLMENVFASNLEFLLGKNVSVNHH